MCWLGFSLARLSSAGCLFSKCLAFSSLNQQASLDMFSSWWWQQCKKWAETHKASQVRSSELAQCPFHLIPLAKARLLVKHKVNRWGNSLHLFNGGNYKPIWQRAEHREGQANWANNSICGRLWAYNQISCVNKPTRLREGKIISQPTNWTHTYLFMSSTDIYWIPTTGQTLFEAHATMTNKNATMTNSPCRPGLTFWKRRQTTVFSQRPQWHFTLSSNECPSTNSYAYNSTKRRGRALKFMYNFSVLENGSLDYQGL